MPRQHAFERGCRPPDDSGLIHPGHGAVVRDTLAGHQDGADSAPDCA